MLANVVSMKYMMQIENSADADKDSLELMAGVLFAILDSWILLLRCALLNATSDKCVPPRANVCVNHSTGTGQTTYA